MPVDAIYLSILVTTKKYYNSTTSSHQQTNNLELVKVKVKQTQLYHHVLYMSDVHFTRYKTVQPKKIKGMNILARKAMQNVKGCETPDYR